MKKINLKERKLISSLRKNGREKIKRIAEDNNFPVSTMFDTLKRLEDMGIVDHRTHVDFEKLGFPIRQFHAVKSSLSSRDKLAKFLAKVPNVNSISVINSGYDYLFETIFRNQKEAQEFEDALQKKFLIQEKNTFNIIDSIHKEKFLSEENHFE